MKAAYVRPGGPLYPAKKDTAAKRVGVRQFFWDATDPAIQDGTVLKAMRAAGWWVGTTYDPTWQQPYPSSGVLAATLSAFIDKLAGPGVQHSTIMDVEAHNPSYILDTMVDFRSRRPGRYLYWTLEPFQAGWITDKLAQWINDDPYTRIVPQLYYGDKVPAPERPVSERAVLNDLEVTGIHDSRVRCYYDRLEAGWDGVLFDWTNIATGLT